MHRALIGAAVARHGSACFRRVGTSRRERFARVWPSFVVSGLARRSSQQGAVAPGTRRRRAVSWAAANRYAPTAIRAAPRPTPRNAPVASRHRCLADTLTAGHRSHFGIDNRTHRTARSGRPEPGATASQNPTSTEQLARLGYSRVGSGYGSRAALAPIAPWRGWARLGRCTTVAFGRPLLLCVRNAWHQIPNGKLSAAPC